MDHNLIIYFGLFGNLQSLALKIPIFDECYTYYNVLWNDNLGDGMYCPNMKRLKLEFEWTDVNHFEGRTNNHSLYIPMHCVYKTIAYDLDIQHAPIKSHRNGSGDALRRRKVESGSEE
eukprot:773352_1